MLKKVWRDPVGSNVIAGLVLVACGAAATYLLNWWPSIIRAVMAAWRFLWQRTAVPNAVVGLLLILASTTVIRAVALRSAGRTWRDYKSDVFFGLRWRWSYYGGAILGLASFCPRCDFQVYPQHDSPFRAVERIAYRCDSCGDLAAFDEPVESLESRVERRSIQQKVRNGTWVSALAAPAVQPRD